MERMTNEGEVRPTKFGTKRTGFRPDQRRLILDKAKSGGYDTHEEDYEDDPVIEPENENDENWG